MAAGREPGTFEMIRRFQLPGGPAGRTGLLVAIAVLALAVIAWAAGDAIRFFCVLGVVGLTIYAIVQTLRHAKENPVATALDGAEVIQYQQCLGTKNDPRILPSELVAEVLRPAERRAGASTSGGTGGSNALPEPEATPETEPDAPPPPSETAPESTEGDR